MYVSREQVRKFGDSHILILDYVAMHGRLTLDARETELLLGAIMGDDPKEALRQLIAATQYPPEMTEREIDYDEEAA